MSAEISKVDLPLPSTAASRLGWGLGSTVLGQIISAANAILLVPLFLRAWGGDGYGQWLTLTALVSYLTLLDFGGQSFIGNLMAREYVSGNEDGFVEKLSEGVSLFAMIAFLAFCLLGIILTLPGFSLPGHSVPLDLNERLVLLFMGAAFLIAVPGSVYITTYRATGLFARGTMVSNIVRSIGFLSYAAILALGVSPTIYAAGFLINSSIGTLVFIWDIRRKIPVSRRISLSLASAWAGRFHVSGSIHFWLLAVANGLKQQGVILVLAASLSPVIVALYATHRTITGLVNYVSMVMQAPVWPELTFLHAQERKDDLARTALLLVKLVVLLSTGAALVLLIFGPSIYPLWTGRKLQLQPTLLGLFLIQAILFSGWSTSGWSLLASNQHRNLAYSSLANAALTIIAAVILAPRFGVLGVALATLLGDVVCGAIIYPWLASHALGFQLRKMYEAILVPCLAVMPVGFLLFLVASLIKGWLFLLVGVVIGALIIYSTARLAFGKGDDVEWALAKFRNQWRARA